MRLRVLQEKFALEQCRTSVAEAMRSTNPPCAARSASAAKWRTSRNSSISRSSGFFPRFRLGVLGIFVGENEAVFHHIAVLV